MKLLPLLMIGFAALFVTGCDTEEPALAPQWEKVTGASTATINCLSFTRSDLGVAVCDGGVIQSWDGESWTATQLETLQNINSVILTGQEAWAVGDLGYIYHMTSDGFWSKVDSPTMNDLLAIAHDSNGVYWAVGRQGTILQYDSNIWQQVISPVSDDLRGLVFSSSGWGRAVGSGVALNYANGTWSIASSWESALMGNGVDIYASSAWAVGLGGAIIRNDGGNWYELESPTSNTLWGISMDNEGNGWACGDLGTAVRLGADGSMRPARLTAQPDDSTALRAVAVISVNEAWMAGDQGALYHFH